MFNKIGCTMDFLKKLTIPFLLIAIIAIIYSTYFAGNKGLGSFASFDTNNNANKEIRVKIIQERGINLDMQNGIVTFYAADKNGTQQLVQAPVNEKIKDAKIVLLRGHLHEDHFHATEIEID